MTFNGKIRGERELSGFLIKAVRPGYTCTSVNNKRVIEIETTEIELCFAWYYLREPNITTFHRSKKEGITSLALICLLPR